MKENLNSQELLSLDTFWDRWVHRPPAKIIAKALSKTSVTPNQVTLFTLVPGVLAAWCFSKSNFSSGLWAFLFFYLWAMLDHADGDLARLTHRTSEFGRKLDDACDDIASLMILSGIYIGVFRLLNGPFRWALSLLFLAGLILNVVSGVLVLEAKRKAREEAIKNKTVTKKLIRFHKLLDHLTGRDPFYLLVFAVLWTFFWQGPWQNAALGILIGGVYFISLTSFTSWVFLTRKK